MNGQLMARAISRQEIKEGRRGKSKVRKCQRNQALLEACMVISITWKNLLLRAISAMMAISTTAQVNIPIQVVLGLGLFALGGWSFVIWGVFVRLVLVFHFTWFVNSATHKFGYQSHESKDHSRNCWWVALLTFGEGWHNNHHAYQYSARHGLQWWEVDLTWMTIRLLNVLGLASDIKLPPSNQMKQDGVA
jgi:fatty-acid desaturase